METTTGTIATPRSDAREPVRADHGRRAPGPFNWPFIGQSLAFWLDPLDYTLKLQRKYGDVVRYHVRGEPIYLLGHPDHVRYVFDRNPTNYRKSDFYDAVKPFFGNGLVLSEGEFWKRQRQTMQPTFHRERIVEMTRVMQRGATELTDSWQEFARSGEPFDVVNRLMCSALNTATRSLFGVDSDDVFERMSRSLPPILKGAEKRIWSILPLSYKLPLPTNLRFNRAVRELDDVVWAIINERKRTGRKASPGDLLDMLLEARDDDGNGLTDQQLRDEVLTIFIAGFETVASAMSFTLVLLAHHLEIQERVLAEVDGVLGGASPDYETARSLPELTNAFQEAMRLYPPVWTVSRALVDDDEIGGFAIPAEATVQIAPYLMHRDPRWWDRPDQFYPDHFTKEREAARPRYAYMPFGGGPRVCLGRNFAMMEGPIVLGTLLQRYRVEPGSDGLSPPEAMISLRPRKGAWIRLEPRGQ
jgi:cytochrome P450